MRKHIKYQQDLPDEIWKSVVGYEGIYEVSNKGRVKSLPKQKGVHYINWSSILSTKIDKSGYVVVALSNDNKMTHLHLHSLVAKAFIENPTNRPCVNHIDGNKQNNNAENLEWVDYFENMSHAVDKNLLKAKGENNSQSKLTPEQVLKIFHSKESHNNLARQFNISPVLIGKIKYGYNWNHVTGLPLRRRKKYKTKRYGAA